MSISGERIGAEHRTFRDGLRRCHVVSWQGQCHSLRAGQCTHCRPTRPSQGLGIGGLLAQADRHDYWCGDLSGSGNRDDLADRLREAVGPAGADKGAGGKYLILPPGYKEKVPDGYIVLRALTYQGYALLRSILKSGSDADIVKAVRTASYITLDHNEFWQNAAVTPISENAQGVDKTGGSDVLA